MSWIKLDDGCPEHRKQLAAGAEACWLWFCGLAYANRQKARDGFIPDAKVPLLYPLKAAARLAARLVEAGLWERVPGGYQIHDYHEYQPSAETAEATSEVKAHAGRLGGLRSGEVRRSKSEARTKHGASSASEAETKHGASVLPKPVPTRPGEEAPLQGASSPSPTPPVPDPVARDLGGPAGGGPPVAFGEILMPTEAPPEGAARTAAIARRCVVMGLTFADWMVGVPDAVWGLVDRRLAMRRDTAPAEWTAMLEAGLEGATTGPPAEAPRRVDEAARRQLLREQATTLGVRPGSDDAA